MPRAQAVATRQAELDVEFCCAVAVASSLAFLVFVALPVRVDVLEIPVALQGLWQLGILVGAFLGPVAAGVAAFISASMLLARGAGLTRRAKRLYFSTIMVSLVLLVVYVVNSRALRTWLD